MRAERILNTRLLIAYRLDESDPNILKCILPDNSIKYVNIVTRKELPAASLKIVLDQWGTEDTKKLTDKTDEQPGKYTAAVDFAEPEKVIVVKTPKVKKSGGAKTKKAK